MQREPPLWTTIFSSMCKMLGLLIGLPSAVGLMMAATNAGLEYCIPSCWAGVKYAFVLLFFGCVIDAILWRNDTPPSSE